MQNMSRILKRIGTYWSVKLRFPNRQIMMQNPDRKDPGFYKNCTPGEDFDKKSIYLGAPVYS